MTDAVEWATMKAGQGMMSGAARSGRSFGALCALCVFSLLLGWEGE